MKSNTGIYKNLQHDAMWPTSFQNTVVVFYLSILPIPKSLLNFSPLNQSKLSVMVPLNKEFWVIAHPVYSLK